jgi:aconitate hydratase
MLGQPATMLLPEVIGFKVMGKLPEGATATDLVLTATQMLRKKGVVDKFVEFYGPGLSSLGLADRATIANMAPEYGATMGFFPVDAETIRYLERTGRDAHTVKVAETYFKAQGSSALTPRPTPSSLRRSADLSTVKSSMAGPKRPQDLVPLDTLKRNFYVNLPSLMSPKTPAARREVAEAAYSRWMGEGGGNVMIGHRRPWRRTCRRRSRASTRARRSTCGTARS